MSIRTRALAAAAAGALLAPLTPFAAPALVNHITPRSRERACPPGEVTGGQYSDVDAANTFALEINCLSDYGIARGTTESTYTPGAPVLRRQMALAYRFGQLAGVPFQHRHRPRLHRRRRPGRRGTRRRLGLANANLVRGTTPTTFTPTVRSSATRWPRSSPTRRT